jgi:phospholipid/cholesterol/gamma-HCH transport system permease protein
MRRTTAKINRLFLWLSNVFLEVTGSLRDALVLLSDLTFFSFMMLFQRRATRQGEFIRNTLNYGLGAVPIIAIIMFLIGFISALQSAAQLRLVGANLFVADLLAVGMTAEMGPLMAAIIVTGRSGSSIASEIATMKYTEELDALKTMGLNPIRFVMVPKFWAMFISMPILTMFSSAMGILGGTVIAVTYLNLSFDSFWGELTKALMFRDILSGTVKSLCYAMLITVIGCHEGLKFSGGADGVGRATTKSVVTSIFWIIAADSVLGLLFYFK